MLPASAILERDGKTMVWVVDPGCQDGRAGRGRPSPSSTRAASGCEGLDPGTRVVTAGVHSLEPGQAVRLTEGAAL